MSRSFRRNPYYAVLAATTCLLILLAFAGSRLGDAAEDPVCLTEICIKNDINAYDDNGEYGADYIELFNRSTEDLYLKGYALSDDKDDLQKVLLDQVVIKAGETVMVWCSENVDDVTVYAKDYVPRDLHQTSFALRGGEKVYLSKDGTIIETVRIPEKMPEDQVYSCVRTDLTSFHVTDPSPYEVKEEREKKDREKNTESPVFSAESGWYTDPFSLELTCKKGTIYYTTDGSEPGPDSKEYTDAIYVGNRSLEENLYSAIDTVSIRNPYLPADPIDKATVVKAVSCVNGVFGETVSKTYFVGLEQDPEYAGLSVMEITMDPDDLFGYEDGIYCTGKVFDTYTEKFDPASLDESYIHEHANYAMEGRGWERPADVDFYDADHELLFTQRLGIRIHGGWSVSYNQKGFNLYARQEYSGEDHFRYDFFGKQTGKLMLRTGGYRDGCVTKIRDLLNQSLVSDRALGIQEGIPCVVFLNGEYWGLYNLQETIGTDYISETYHVEKDNILLVKSGREEVPEYEELVAFASSEDLTVDENYRYVEARIDIQSYIDYMAFQIYIANCDSVGNNYACWRTREPETGEYGDCKWRFLPYDTDDSTGIDPYVTHYKVDSFIGGHILRNPLGEQGDPLFSALMENPEFKERFVTTFMDMASANFRYEKVTEVLGRMADAYEQGLIASQNRFRGEYVVESYSQIDTYEGTYDEDVFRADIDVIDEFYKNRMTYVVKYIKEDLDLKGEHHVIGILPTEPEHCSVSVNTIDGIRGGWAGTYFSDYPIAVSCMADPGYRFAGWIDEAGELLSEEAGMEIMLTKDRTIFAVVVSE